MSMNGCYNREPLTNSVLVQTGWTDAEYDCDTNKVNREPMYDWVWNPMTKDCQYSIRTKDPECKGCKHNQQEKVSL